MAKVTILEETILTPITFIGQCAGIAYDSDTSNSEKNYKRGLQCVKDRHYRMLEFCDVFMEIDGYSCRVIREFARHVGDGLTIIQRSTRYCNEEDFGYYIPDAVQNNMSARAEYNKCMTQIQKTYNKLTELYNIKKEDAANILPLGMCTKLAVKKNARNLSDMAAQRLCNRALKEYRELMQDVINALCCYSEEWKTLCNMIMKCKCDKVGWCEEKFSCGKYPKKENIEVVEKNLN